MSVIAELDNIAFWFAENGYAGDGKKNCTFTSCVYECLSSRIPIFHSIKISINCILYNTHNLTISLSLLLLLLLSSSFSSICNPFFFILSSNNNIIIHNNTIINQSSWTTSKQYKPSKSAIGWSNSPDSIYV